MFAHIAVHPYAATSPSLIASRGEIGHEHYQELGSGKLDGVNFKRVPANEPQGAELSVLAAGCGSGRAGTNTGSTDKIPTPRTKTAKWIGGNEYSACSCQKYESAAAMQASKRIRLALIAVACAGGAELPAVAFPSAGDLPST